MNKQKNVPSFRSPDEEARFWEEHDSAEYIDWSQANQAVFPNLKRSTVSISLRLPTWLLERIKELANEKDVPYQSLMKVYLCNQVKQDIEEERKYKLTSRGSPYSTKAVTSGWIGEAVDAVKERREQANTNNNNKEGSGW